MPKQQVISARELRLAGDAATALRIKEAHDFDGASEKKVVGEIVTALRMRGYCTPREWKPGKRGIFIRVGQLKAKGSGTDEGAPDLILIHLGTGRCTLVEVKARTKEARASKEQNTLAQLGAIVIVTSASQVLALLEG
jgi:hypothetical protein